MNEANFQTLFRKFLEEKSHPPMSQAFELKIVKNGKPFAFSQVKPHQIEGLKKAKTGMFYKISDAPIFGGQKTRFTAPKPFDCFWITAVNAWVVIYFYHPRQEKKFYMIEIGDFEELVRKWERKSIREEELMGTGLARFMIMKGKKSQPKKKLQS